MLPLAGAVSPEAASDYADGAVSPEGGSDAGEGPSPPSANHRAFSSQHMQHMELASAMEGGSDPLGDMSELSLLATSPGHAAASAAAARVHGLRDDAPGN